MSVEMEGLLLSLPPWCLKRDLLRNLIAGQLVEIAAHCGLAAADLFQQVDPELQAPQLQEIGRRQAVWLATTVGKPLPRGSHLWANALPATGAEPLASLPTELPGVASADDVA